MIEVFDGFRAQLAANRTQFYREVPILFYGDNRLGATISQGVVDKWWRQGMLGGAKAQYDCIEAFSETDFTEDLARIEVPTLVMHGDDDQIVPFADSAPLSARIVQGSILKVYPGYPHGMPVTQAEHINDDLLDFIRGGSADPRVEVGAPPIDPLHGSIPPKAQPRKPLREAFRA